MEDSIAADANPALMVSGVPWAARLHQVGLTGRCAPPRRTLLGKTFGTRTTVDISWRPTAGSQGLDALAHLGPGAHPGTVHGPACPGVRIKHRQPLHPPSLGGLLQDAILTPDMVGIPRPSRCRHALASRAPLVHALHHLEPLLLPEPPDRRTPDAPRRSLHQVGARLIPQAWRLRRRRLRRLITAVWSG
jgi:hypothetical protein